MPKPLPIAAWQREIEREEDPRVKAFLERCLAEQLADATAAAKPSTRGRSRHSPAAIRAGIEWQKP